MQYYGTKLTENISRRKPEGYLLCLNVPVARTGAQDYLPEELGLPPGPGPVSVFRSETEVFAPETMASFEGMPVTNDHPPDGVDIENIRRLQMGHAHNVRRGSGEESDLLLADLIITDERLVDAILAGKREISCGYTYELAEENGQYIQRKIRGNHIAVVDAGRAGPRVSIKDRKPTERRNPMKKSLSKILARMAKDGDVETVAEFIEEMIEETAETPAEGNNEGSTGAFAEAAAEEVVEAVAGGEEPVIVEAPEAKEITIDEESIAGIIERLDRLIALLTPAAGDEDLAGGPAETAEEIAEIVEEVVEAVAEEPVAETPSAAETEIAELIESIVDPEVSVTLEEPEGDEDPADPDKPCASDAMSAALLAVRPALAKMTLKQRKKVCADIAARFRRRSPNGMDSRYAARKTGGNNYAALGRRIMAARNANYRK